MEPRTSKVGGRSSLYSDCVLQGISSGLGFNIPDSEIADILQQTRNCVLTSEHPINMLNGIERKTIHVKIKQSIY